jgi:tRNA uridine 5-carboxymethylaminomethyl modification enzyme
VRRSFQVIIIGGGHAGVEAAWAAANLLPGERTVALVTIDPTNIGVMSCNPANGGLAKGQLVREIDAMGGVMGLATDATGIQFKMLNTSKGPAVHGPRAQCDKHAYAQAVQRLIASRPEVEVIAGTVERLGVEGGEVRGVLVRTTGTEPRDIELSAKAVVLTTGTFMRALMHTGEHRSEGGRFGEAAAVGISGAMRGLGFELGRLKTGTPPRLRRSTIRWDELPAQHGDSQPVPFSDLTAIGLPGAVSRTPGTHATSAPKWAASYADHTCSILSEWAESGFVQDTFPLLPQIECRQTSTNAASHEVIRDNLHRAPMYSGQIESIGPRYCPSIEDKVVRFAQRESHGVFLEPESLHDDWIYCNGVSTSLPGDVQDAIVRSLPGCERAEILRYGYAVEYDMVRPHQIVATGETRLVRGLFLAGQINGTSGYEEAAAQGLIAGINAARRARGEGEFILGRDQAYIGVLMDDLCTKTPVEPYRMFTSRAEHRLLLRADNASERLTPIAERLGLLDSTGLGRRRSQMFQRRRAQAASLEAMVDSIRVEGQPLAHLLRGDRYDLGAFRAEVGSAIAGATFDAGVWRLVHAERRYAPYIVRQRAEVKRQSELEHRHLPEGVSYDSFASLRAEARGALNKFRPRTFGQASRLEGITPADVTLLAVLIDRLGKSAAQR